MAEHGVSLSASVNDDAADALARVHQVEALVDVFQPHDVGDHRVDLDLALHIHVDNLRHVGAALRAAERGAAPVAPGDEPERTRRNLLARHGDADDARGAPAAVARSEEHTSELQSPMSISYSVI